MWFFKKYDFNFPKINIRGHIAFASSKYFIMNSCHLCFNNYIFIHGISSWYMIYMSKELLLQKIQLSPIKCVIQNHIVFQNFGDEITSKRCLAFFVSCISNTNSRSIVTCFFLSFRLAFGLSVYPNLTSKCS